MAIFDLKKAVITLSDGTASTPLTMTVKMGSGNLTIGETKNLEYVLDRGLLDTVRELDEAPVDVKWEGQWIFLKGDAGDTYPISLRDALTKTGGAAAWVSSASDACAPYAVDLTVVYTPCAGKTETILISDFRWEKLDYDAKAGTISVTGKANVKAPTFTRT